MDWALTFPLKKEKKRKKETKNEDEVPRTKLSVQVALHFPVFSFFFFFWWGFWIASRYFPMHMVYTDGAHVKKKSSKSWV